MNKLFTSRQSIILFGLQFEVFFFFERVFSCHLNKKFYEENEFFSVGKAKMKSQIVNAEIQIATLVKEAEETKIYQLSSCSSL